MLATFTPMKGERVWMTTSSRGVSGAVSSATASFVSLPPRTHAELRAAAERLGGEAVVERVLVVDRLPVDRHDQVAGLQARRAPPGSSR